jgi:glucuronoarabinoxylan endo-1,4-beta-xylanase
VTVKLDQARQTIDGFGINNNWQPAMTDAEADALFDASKGIGLTILRIGMGSDGKHYNSASPGDITKAKARGLKYVIGSTWSPPKEWKTNGKEEDGGYLKTEYYEQWATRIADFAKSNSLYAMSPGNEPDFASCGMTEPCNGNYPTTLYTAKQMVDFIKIVGPKLQAAGVKVLAPEASEWLHNWSNISATGSDPGKKNSSDPLKCGCFGNSATATPTGTCSSECTAGNGYDYGHWLYKDSKAWAAVDIMGVHQYDTQVAEPWPADVPDKKPVWQTEMSGVKWWPEQGPNTTIENGVAVAGWLHSALTVGELNAWLWWWYKAQGSTNEGLLLSSGTDTKRHYTFGNFTKFIRPGYVRVDVGGSVPANVLMTAYKGTDSTVVIVAINKGSAEAKFSIAIAGGTPASCTPNVTSKDADLKAGTAVTVTDGSFSASLGGTSVTTFVCK